MLLCWILFLSICFATELSHPLLSDRSRILEYYHDGSRPLSSFEWRFAKIVVSEVDCSENRLQCKIAGLVADEEGRASLAFPVLRIMSSDGSLVVHQIEGFSHPSKVEPDLVKLEAITVSDIVSPDTYNIFHYTNDADLQLLSLIPNNSWMVLFHSPGCPSCAFMEPVLKSFARVHPWKTSTLFVNCARAGSQLCRQLDVLMVPAIKLFAYGNWHSFQGDPDFNGLALFASRSTTRVLENVSLISFGQLHKKHNVFFVLLLRAEDELKESNTQIMAAVRKVAEELVMNSVFVWSNDGRIIGGNHLIPAEGSLTAFKGSSIFQYRGRLSDLDQVRNWARYQQFNSPVLVNFFNFDSIMNGSRTVFMLHCNEAVNQELASRTESLFRKFAQSMTRANGFAEDLIFAELEGFEVLYRFYERKFGRRYSVAESGERICKLLLYNPVNKTACWKDANERLLDPDNLAGVVEEWREGKLQFTTSKDNSTFLARNKPSRGFLLWAFFFLVCLGTHRLLARLLDAKNKRRKGAAMKNSIVPVK